MGVSRSAWKSVLAFLSAIAVVCGVISAAGAEVKEIGEWQSTPAAPDGWYEPASGDAATNRPNAIGTLVKVGAQQMSGGLGATMGMCIDTLMTSPEESPQTQYGAPTKLESVVTPDPQQVREAGYTQIPFEGDLRDSAIYVAKLAVKAWQDANKEDFADYSVALQYLLSSHRLGQYPTGAFGPERARASHNLTAERFLEITGYKQSKVDPTVDGFTFERDTSVSIPHADDDEYLTVLEPTDYSSYFETTANGRIALRSSSGSQRVLPIDQPGLNMDFNPSLSSSITPKVMEAKPETSVVDTVHYQGLVPNTTYTLQSTLVNKANRAQVLGSQDLTFTTGEANELDGSVSGTQEVTIDITVGANEIIQVKSAVAFASLYSEEVDAAGNPSESMNSGGGQGAILIAEHNDIDDSKQTVSFVSRSYTDNGLGEQVFGAKSTPVENPYADGFSGTNGVAYTAEVTKIGGIYVPEPQPGRVYGLGWCIDFGLINPGKNTTYTVPGKLTHIQEKDGTGLIPLEGDLRDSAIHVLKTAVKAYKDGDFGTAKTYGTVLNVLLGSYPQGISYFVSGSAQGGVNGVTLERFKELSGFALTGGNGAEPAALVRDTSIDIPQAGDDEYITAMAPIDYFFSSLTASTEQRIVPIDQPGLREASEPELNEFVPKISTSVSPKSVELTSGMQVVDTVSYEGLAPNTEYMLTATLVDKADESKVLGESESVVFTTPASEDGKSVSGTQDVPIRVTASDDQLTGVKAAVVFEELSSKVVDKQGNKLDEPVKTLIAEHKDINDAAQTVVNYRPEPLRPAISTSATLQSVKGQVVKGATVIDTVSYIGLVPGKQYTLTAELVDKADGVTVVGSGSATFTPESADGQVDVEIAVTVEKPVASAVAFETLTSTQVKADGSENPDGSEQVIAEHKDLEDAAQTVTSDFKPALQLKKLLNGVDADDADGQDVTEPGDPRGDRLVAHEAGFVELASDAGSFELTFQVQNTGDVDLENITVADRVTDSVDGDLAGSLQAAIDTALAGKSIESLAVGEMKEITVTVTLPEGITLPAGWKHHDVAKATGEYTPQGADKPEPVVSNEDEANAHTPKPELNRFVPKISTSVDPKEVELSSGVTVTDTVSFEGLAPDTEYVLTATLVDQANEGSVVGESGPVVFTTGAANQPDGSVKGTKDVPIRVTASDEQLTGVKAAVVFEELTSRVVDKQGNRLAEPKETLIVEHKDVDDDSAGVVNFVVLRGSGEVIDPEIHTQADRCRLVTDENYWPRDCNIIRANPQVSAYSSPEVRGEAVAELLGVINEAAGQKVVEFVVEPERDFVRVVVHPDYDLGSHGDRFGDIQKALRQYGFTEIEVIA